MCQRTPPTVHICGHVCIVAMWTYGRTLRRGQVPFLVYIKVQPGPSVAMENGRTVSKGNTLTSGNHIQKAAMFAPIPLTRLVSTDKVHVECCGDLRSATEWIEGPHPHVMPEGVSGVHLVGSQVAKLQQHLFNFSSEDRISLCSPGWPCTLGDPPFQPPELLRSQMGAIIPGVALFLLL